MEHTHLVKGLDFALLNRVKSDIKVETKKQIKQSAAKANGSSNNSSKEEEEFPGEGAPLADVSTVWIL